MAATGLVNLLSSKRSVPLTVHHTSSAYVIVHDLVQIGTRHACMSDSIDLQAKILKFSVDRNKSLDYILLVCNLTARCAFIPDSQVAIMTPARFRPRNFGKIALDLCNVSQVRLS